MNTTQTHRQTRRVATIAASTMIVAGLTGTVVDNNGEVGRALFFGAALSAIYLFGAWLLPRAGKRPSSHRPFLRPWLLGAAVAVGVTGLIGANFVKSTDDGASGIANRFFVSGFVIAAATLAVTTIATVVNWLRPIKATHLQRATPPHADLLNTYRAWPIQRY